MNAPFHIDAAGLRAAFERDGYSVHNAVLAASEVDSLRQAIDAIPLGQKVRRKKGVYGIRNLLEICSAVAALSTHEKVRSFATSVLGEHAFAVRAIFFDKVPDANWSLFWHQDNVIAVKRRLEEPGFVGWSQKSGVWQVQPPAEILARMVAVRVHLDDCGATNGPLRVLPGSHRFGWLDDQINEWKSRIKQVTCEVSCGGIVTMCPLVLHASGASTSVGHRRVIHIEYADDDLPNGLEWNSKLSPVAP